MRLSGSSRGWAGLLVAMLLMLSAGSAMAQPSAASKVQTALENIVTLVRPGEVGYATVWDGNKYVQCRRVTGGELACEAAGSLMQPSLENVLEGKNHDRLAKLGWARDDHFGNYVRVFSADMALDDVAEAIVQTLTEAYEANISWLEVKTAWIRDTPCPPRNGPTQNLAGMVNDAPEMQASAIKDCAYKPEPGLAVQTTTSSKALFARYGARVTGEVQRLRVNAADSIFVIFNAGIGYVQCMPDKVQSVIYCEAQSVESWPALAAVLTPERLALLQAAGYADPGRSPNHWKNYGLDDFSDETIAREILTILHAVYGYGGEVELQVVTN